MSQNDPFCEINIRHAGFLQFIAIITWKCFFFRLMSSGGKSMELMSKAEDIFGLQSAYT